MAKLDEIITDKETYPDESKITLVDGSELTLGEVRSGYLKDADYRRKTTALSREREQLERQVSQKELEFSAAEERMTDLAREIMERRAGTSKEAIAEEIESDPKAKALLTKLSSLEQNVAGLRTELGRRDKIARDTYYNALVTRHKETLAKLKEQDKDLDEEGLVEYARSEGIPFLDKAYKALKYDEAVLKAKKEGDKEGYKRAKDEPPSPLIPVRKVTKPAADRPKTFDEALEAAISDPDIAKGLTDDLVSGFNL